MSFVKFSRGKAMLFLQECMMLHLCMCWCFLSVYISPLPSPPPFCTLPRCDILCVCTYNQCGQVTTAVCFKMSCYFQYFISEMVIPGIFLVTTKHSETLMQMENVENWGEFCSQSPVKNGFYCTDFCETHKCPTSWHGVLYRLLV